jgi:hypothetical protein
MCVNFGYFVCWEQIQLNIWTKTQHTHSWSIIFNCSFDRLMVTNKGFHRTATNKSTDDSNCNCKMMHIIFMHANNVLWHFISVEKSRDDSLRFSLAKTIVCVRHKLWKKNIIETISSKKKTRVKFMKKCSLYLILLTTRSIWWCEKMMKTKLCIKTGEKILLNCPFLWFIFWCVKIIRSHNSHFKWRKKIAMTSF